MLLADSLTNLMAGFGTDKDKVAFGQFGERSLDQATIDALYSSDWVAGTIVDAPAEDATREWRSWQAGPRQITALEETEARLGLQAKVRQALKLARKDGGAAIWLGINNAGDPETPLDVARVGIDGLAYLHVFSINEISAGALQGNPRDPFYGEPTEYTINAGETGQIKIHPSRIVRFLGQEPIERRNLNAWGASVLQRVYDAVLHYATAATSVATMTVEAKVDVFGVKGLTMNAQNLDWRARMLARFALANTSKSTNNALIRDAEEEWEQKQLSFANIPEVVRMFLETCAGAGGMPISRLLGKAPSGLNSGVAGDAETRAWYDKVAGIQKTELRPTLSRLDRVLRRSALGTAGDKVWYLWNPLWQMTEAEKAAIAKDEAEATAIYGSGDILPPNALRQGVRNQLIERGVYPGLEGALAASDAAKEAPKAIIQKAAPAPAKKPAKAPVKKEA